MTKSHKVLVFVPPLLIGFTILMILFGVQHRLNQQAVHSDSTVAPATSTADYVITKPVPLPPVDISLDVATSRPNPNDMVACTMEAKQCPDGSFVGRSGPNCEFAPCPSQTNSSAGSECELSQREVDACIEIFAPVCASYQVQCVTTPCPPVPKTYPNSCFACADNNVLSYTEGACIGEYE